MYWANGNIQKTITGSFDVSRTSMSKFRDFLIAIINKHLRNCPIRLEGYWVKVQVNENMLNYKVKSHRGRSPNMPIWCIGIIKHHIMQVDVNFKLFQIVELQHLQILLQKLLGKDQL